MDSYHTYTPFDIFGEKKQWFEKKNRFNHTSAQKNIRVRKIFGLEQQSVQNNIRVRKTLGSEKHSVQHIIRPQKNIGFRNTFGLEKQSSQKKTFG